MSYTVTDLRDDLAATIKALRSGDAGMTVEKAKAISELGQTMINSAKAEVEMLKVIGRRHTAPASGFIPLESQPDSLDLQDGDQQRRLDGPGRPKPHIYSPVGSAPRGSLR